MKVFILCVVLVLFWAMFITLIGLLTTEAIDHTYKQDRLLYNDFTKHL